MELGVVWGWMDRGGRTDRAGCSLFLVGALSSPTDPLRPATEYINHPRTNPSSPPPNRIINGIFCACVPRATANRFSLLLVISGLVLAGVVSLALDRPMVLEQAREHVASRAEEEHAIFQRYCRRLSWGLLVLNLLQWPCFFAAAVFLSDAQGGCRWVGWSVAAQLKTAKAHVVRIRLASNTPCTTDMVVLTLVLLLPVSMLVIYIGLAFVYGFVSALEGSTDKRDCARSINVSACVDLTYLDPTLATITHNRSSLDRARAAGGGATDGRGWFPGHGQDRGRPSQGQTLASLLVAGTAAGAR